jgi:hypothetical protein
MNQITQFFVGTGTTESKLWELQNWPRFGQVMKITIQKKLQSEIRIQAQQG